MNNRTCTFPGCNKPLASRGLCDGHAKQDRKGHQLTPLKISSVGLSLSQAFDKRVVRSDGCWAWKGVFTANGYGRMSYRNKGYLAHRASWIIHFGHIPDGMEIDHTCFTRECANPSHLRMVTHKQNQENRSGPKKGSKTGVRGVWWHERDKRFIAKVGHEKKVVWTGRFKTLEEAEAAVIEARNHYFTHNELDKLKA